MAPTVATVLATTRESHDTVTLVMAGRDTPLTEPHPGQFNMLYAFGVGEVPISVSRIEPGPFAGSAGPVLWHTIRGVGAVTEALCAMEVGDELGMRGPFGVGWNLGAAEGGDAVVMAGGIGLAPVRPVVDRLRRSLSPGRTLSVLVGFRNPSEMCFADDLAEWAADPGVHLGVTVDRPEAGWRGPVGVVTDLVGAAPFDPAATEAFVCGPEVMMTFGARRLQRAGVLPERIQLSAERNMACAVGHCGHCQLAGLLLCRDGPVCTYPVLEPLLGVREW